MSINWVIDFLLDHWSELGITDPWEIDVVLDPSCTGGFLWLVISDEQSNRVITAQFAHLAEGKDHDIDAMWGDFKSEYSEIINFAVDVSQPNQLWVIYSSSIFQIFDLEKQPDPEPEELVYRSLVLLETIRLKWLSNSSLNLEDIFDEYRLSRELRVVFRRVIYAT